MSNGPRLSFESGEAGPSTKNVKLDTKKSRFAKQAETKINFEKKVDEVHNTMVSRQQQVFDLGKQFLELMRDKTLPENKGPMQTSLEREILNKLTQFAIEVNNDENEGESMGSISMIVLLLKSSLIMRDNYNKMEYKVEQLEKQLKLLKSSAPPTQNDK